MKIAAASNAYPHTDQCCGSGGTVLKWPSWIRIRTIYQTFKGISEKSLIPYSMLSYLQYLTIYFFSITTKCPGPDPEVIGLPNPDPSFRITNPWIRIPKKNVRIHNTATNLGAKCFQGYFCITKELVQNETKKTR
jgi:hypothetical protein